MDPDIPNRKQFGAQLSRRTVLYIFGFLIVFSLSILPRYLRGKRSAGWPSGDGVITSSWINSRYAKGTMWYHGEIEYRYRVQGVDYKGSALSLGRPTWGNQDAWRRILDRYPAGKPVKVFYEPGHPWEGILEPGLHEEMEDLYKLDLIFLWGSVGMFAVCFLWYHDAEKSKSLVPDKPEPLQ